MSLNSAFSDRISQRAARRRQTDLGAPDEATPPDRPCILVVDDEPEISASVKLLMQGDYDVLTATSVEEAEELLGQGSIAVILTDQRMPGTTGTELLARSVHVAPEATRILFTGYSDITAVIDAINSGHVYRYIAKPWRPEELKTVLAQGVDRYRLVSENRELLAQLTRANQELERRVAERTMQLREQNTELRRARERIEALSRIDALTGLGSRGWLDEVLPRELARAAATLAACSVIMIDLDHFKDVNDEFGHVVGDQVLRGVGAVLAAEARMTDVVARYGGEEILVLLPNTLIDQACRVAEGMRVALRNMPVDFRSEPVTASFGVAQWGPEDSVASLVARADEALYQSKRAGRDRVTCQNPKESTHG